MKGGWLEAGTYLQALLRKRAEPDGRYVASSLKIWDWAGSGPSPTGPNGESLNHYEIDVVVATKGVLHLIECKDVREPTDGKQQDIIHKQGALRRELQGRSGINAIITRSIPPVKSVLRQKAANDQVQYFMPDKKGIDDCMDQIFGVEFSRVS